MLFAAVIPSSSIDAQTILKIKDNEKTVMDNKWRESQSFRKTRTVYLWKSIF